MLPAEINATVIPTVGPGVVHLLFTLREYFLGTFSTVVLIENRNYQHSIYTIIAINVLNTKGYITHFKTHVLTYHKVI